MTQTMDNIAGSDSGTALVSKYNNQKSTLLSSHKGASRPSYAIAGTFWLKDISTTVQEYYFYDGASDILVGTFNPTTHAFTPAGTGGAGSFTTLAASGDFAINTNKFTVAAASGNTQVAGTLDVIGNVAINTNKVTIAASTGNTAIAGTLAVTGATSLGAATCTAPSAGDNSTRIPSTAWVKTELSAFAPGPDVQVFNSSGTWTKPSGRSASALALVECWGAGGGPGGGSPGYGGGGGGGGYSKHLFALSDLSGTVTITIGAGGTYQGPATTGSVGGNTSFGGYLYAGGGGGGTGTGAGGGGGFGYTQYGNSGGSYNSGNSTAGGAGNPDAGGGGGCGTGTAGGAPPFAGAGGLGGSGAGGTAPGGGGGGTGASTGGAGAAGRCKITVIG